MNKHVLASIAFCCGVFTGATGLWMAMPHMEKSVDREAESPKPSNVINEASSVLTETHDGWADCTEKRKEGTKVLRGCVESLKECTELLESADERWSNALKDEEGYTKQLLLSLKRCETGKRD